MRFLSAAVMVSLLSAAVPSGSAAAQAATTYYVDSKAGDDAAAGTSATAPWKSLDPVNAADLKPGDTVSFKRGSSFAGPLTLAAKGTAAKPIVVRAYGTGKPPRITGRTTACVVITGAYWHVSGLRATGCEWAGFEITGDRNVLAGIEADHNVTGVSITRTGARNTVRDSKITDNNRMSVNDEGGDNDSGAFGILINGDDNFIADNTITGSHAKSHDYGVDGAAIEIFSGNRNRILRNISRDNNTFTELGARKGDTATGNLFAFNVVTSTLKSGSFLVTRGAGHVVGPVKGTVVLHNSVYHAGQEDDRLVLPRRLLPVHPQGPQQRHLRGRRGRLRGRQGSRRGGQRLPGALREVPARLPLRHGRPALRLPQRPAAAGRLPGARAGGTAVTRVVRRGGLRQGRQRQAAALGPARGRLPGLTAHPGFPPRHASAA